MRIRGFDEIPELPGGSRLFGHIDEFRDDRLGMLRRLGSFADVATIRFTTRPVVFVSAPELAHELLVERARSFEKSPGQRVLLHDLAGQGLFTSEGELWRRQRRLMAPLFHPTQIGRYAPIVHAVTRSAIASWRDGQTIDVAREMTRITMGVVGKALFDADTFDEADELGAALTTALAWVDEVSASPLLVAQLVAVETLEKWRAAFPSFAARARERAEAELEAPIFLPGRRSAALADAKQRIDRTIARMIAERRAGGLAEDDLLTRLLGARDPETGEGMSDAQVRDEATTIFVAGHETTATTLAWAFYELGKRPDLVEALAREAVGFGADGPGVHDAARMPLALRVIKETMRKYPPIILYPRRALEDVELGGHRIPRGTLVFTSPCTLHHRRDVWPDPDRFDPDRFTEEAEARRPRGAYLPFAAGPRVCIGNHFASMEAPMVLLGLLSRLRFETDPRRVVVPEPFATLRPGGGVPARVRFAAARVGLG